MRSSDSVDFHCRLGSPSGVGGPGGGGDGGRFEDGEAGVEGGGVGEGRTEADRVMGVTGVSGEGEIMQSGRVDD